MRNAGSSRFVSAPMCLACWRARYPEREPVRLRNPEEETCGFCGKLTQSGIYVRAAIPVLRKGDE